MRTNFLIFFLLVTIQVLAEGPRVPTNMEVAGIKLKLTEAARKEIQKDVDALTRSPKYFNIKMERVLIYFPIIEKVFREENVPEDFKYLVIQESALIPDAVSSSNAVGYWQFKEFTGKEVGLRIDRQIDERMHIMEASRGAAKYFKRNYGYFDNWIYALQAYQMGPGGAQKVVDKKYFGAQKMTINKNTYWYVKKFLAHKIAFEKAYKMASGSDKMLAEYRRSANKGLKDISRELEVDLEELEKYNMWLRKGRIPNDKDYVVMVPVPQAKGRSLLDDQPLASKSVRTIYPNEDPGRFPMIKDINGSASYTAEVIKANGLPAVIAKPGNDFNHLALQGAVNVEKFLKYNDLKKSDVPVEGKVYYLKKKKSKARIHYHVVKKGETLWDVSQKYGIKLKKLMQKNRMRKPEILEEGRVLWLRFIRPADHPVEYEPVAIPEVVAPEKEEVKAIEEPEEVIDSVTVNDTSEVVLIEPADTTTLEESEEIITEEETPEEEVKVEIREERIQHRVEKGETLYGIARTYGVKVDDVIKWNEIEINEDYRLPIGEELLILKTVEETISPDLFFHTVQPGETLFQISQKYNVSVEELMELNELEDANLSPGDELKIIKTSPEPIVPNGVKFHEVQPGETLYQIARKYDLTIQELMELNQKEDFNIQIGEKLQVSIE